MATLRWERAKEHNRRIRDAQETPIDWLVVAGNPYAVRKQIKRFGGRWLPSTKTWVLPAHRAQIAQAAIEHQTGVKISLQPYQPLA